MGNALNIEYYFWWRDDYFGLLIHHDAPFHFMVSISDEYKYKRLVKTTFKSCGKPIFLEICHTRNYNAGFTTHQKCQFSAQFSQSHLLISIEWDII